jgi:hypothetical protein
MKLLHVMTAVICLIVTAANAATSIGTINFKRGLDANLPATANMGEPLITTDTHRVLVGTGTGKIELLTTSFTGTATASQFVTNAADGTHIVHAVNTVAYSASPVAGDCQYSAFLSPAGWYCYSGSAWVVSIGAAATTSAAGSMSAGDKTKLDRIQNAEYDNGTCTTAATISAANGTRQKITLTDAQTCTLSFTQPASGTMVVGVKVIQSASGAFAGLISGGKWPGGTIPVITSSSGAVDFISCYLDSTNAYCSAVHDIR